MFTSKYKLFRLELKAWLHDTAIRHCDDDKGPNRNGI
jgi:hypothetical protein